MDTFLNAVRGQCPLWKRKYLPLSWHRVAFEPIRNEYLVFLVLIARGQNIGALNGLVEVSEDVEYRDEALGGVSRSGHICIDSCLAGKSDGRRRRSHVFIPPSCLYVPLGTYPEDKTGGILQQASLWP